MTDRGIKDILIQGATNEYDVVKFQINWDSSFGLYDIQKPMRHLYFDTEFCRGEHSGRITGRGAAMSI